MLSSLLNQIIYILLKFCQIIVVCVQEYFIKYKMRLDNNSLMKFHTFTVRNTICLIRENNFSKHGQQFSTICHLIVRHNMSN